MTKRAKRLADYLEGKLGWTVYDTVKHCKHCSALTNNITATYCHNCGQMFTGKDHDNKETLKELEEALKYALEEEKHENEILCLKSEVERLHNRDGNANIELCYNNGDYPFAREDLKVVDFGVADNCYVVESKLVKELQDKIKELKEKITYMEGNKDES